jgi:TonB family protein
MSILWECIWKTTGTTLLMWAMSQVLRRQSAALRYWLWIAALAAFLTVPALLDVARRTPAIRLAAPVPTAVNVALDAVTVIPEPRPKRQPRRLPISETLAAVWFAGVILIASRRLYAAWRMKQIAGRAVRSGEFEFPVWLSTEIETPLTWGVWSPMILLPRSALRWTPECLNSVLAHEREHIRRFDCLFHWFAEAVCAIWWFHPLAWLARNRASHERECACDDAVLRSGVRPSDYATELLQLASRMPNTGEPVMALSALSDFERRIRSMLRHDLDRRPAGRRAGLGVALASIAVVLPLALLHAQAPSGQGDLSGTVIDMSGARVPNAQIIAAGSGGNREVTRANEAGEWKLSGVPVGNYTIEASSRGFAIARRAVALTAGQRETVEMRLSVGTVQETVNVVSQGQARRPAAEVSMNVERIRVGGNVQATKLIKQVKPKYPESAKAQGIEGTVLLNAIIGKDGNLLSVTVVNKLADPDLAAAALEAVQQWQYQPTLLNGQPVEVVTTIMVNFHLEM